MKHWDVPQHRPQVSKPADDWPDPIRAVAAPAAAQFHIGRQPLAVGVAESEEPKVGKKHKRHAALLLLLLTFAIWLGNMTFRRPAAVAAITNFRQCVDFGYPTTESEPIKCTTSAGKIFTEAVVSLPISNKQNLSFTTIVDAKRGPLQKDLQIIKDQKSWEAFWAKTHAQIQPLPPILAVDFSKLAVAGAVFGQQASAGYRIAVTSIYETEREVEVEVTKWQPGARCVSNTAPESPYHLVTFTKPTKPTVFIIVNKSQAACETQDGVNASVGAY